LARQPLIAPTVILELMGMLIAIDLNG